MGKPYNPDPHEAYDRRPRESARAFSNFQRWRDLGPNRTIRKLHASIAASGDPAPNMRQLEEWSRIHDWLDRAAMWDEHVDRETRAEQLDAIKGMRLEHARLGAAVVAKARVKLEALDASTLSVREAAVLFELGVKIERLSRGETTEEIGVRGETGIARVGRDLVDAALAADPSLAMKAGDLAIEMARAAARDAVKQ